MARTGAAPAAAPETLRVVMLVAVAHHEGGGPAREFGAGQTYALPRLLALRWYARGLAELAEGYQPERGELLEAARAALDDLEGERLAGGQAIADWERIGWNRRRLERLARILSGEAPTTGEAA